MCNALDRSTTKARFNSPSFNDMILHATISTNPISIIIWLALTISSTTICLAWQFTGSTFETEIKKCKAIIARPMQGYSTVDHQIKIDKWTDRKEKLEELLNDILTPLN